MEHDEIVKRYKEASREIFLLGREAARFENSIVMNLLKIASEHFWDLIDTVIDNYMEENNND